MGETVKLSRQQCVELLSCLHNYTWTVKLSLQQYVELLSCLHNNMWNC